MREKRVQSNSVLTQDEIDQLLSAISSGDENKDTNQVKKKDQNHIKIYDFKRPYLYTKENLRALAHLAEKSYAEWSDIDNSIYMHIASVCSLTLEEAIRSYPTPGFYMVGKDVFIEIDPLIYKKFLNIDQNNRKALTQRECKKVKKFVTFLSKPFLKDLKKLGLSFGTKFYTEINPEFFPKKEIHDMGIEVTFEVHYNGEEGMLYIYFPYHMASKNKKFLNSENVYEKMY